MALTVSVIRAWLNTFSDDTLIGISEEDEMCLRPHDERYHEAYLEIGMALSSEYLAQQRLPETNTPDGDVSLDEVRAFAARDRAKRKAGRRPVNLFQSKDGTVKPTWTCDECGATNLPIGDHKSSCSRF